jgi:folate-binding protein YgfZ
MTQRHPFQALRIVGPDAVKTLQGQMTCDVQSLAVGATAPGLLCDIRGRVQIVGWVHKLSQTELWLVTHSSAIEPSLARLRPYLAFSKSKATVLSLEHWVATQNRGGNLDGGGIELGFATLTDASSIDADQPLDMASLTRAQLEAGVPELGNETRAQYTPQALSLDQSGFISFTKGCYMGQEIIARLHYKGQAKQTLVLLQQAYDGDVNDGQLVFDNKGAKVGQIISGGVSGTVLFLACVNKSALAPTLELKPADWVVVKRFSPL